ncbi:anthrax toxin lethal factor-related metalloendopeptidase [Paenibacillus gansuensis]|uniref:S-layer homology domain-containing protein n=1 Tax=Paenibacillus gansuensis TaxID=306542 RepID=A0ABW5PCB8_9BACL
MGVGLLKNIAIFTAAASLLITGSLPASAEASRSYLEHQLIKLPSGTFDREEADAMTSRLFRMYPNLLEGLIYNKIHIKLTNGPITEEPEMAAFKGKTPRGWEGTGKSWDDIPGSGGNPVLVRIGYSERGKGHGSYNLELHETMHAVDRYLFHEVSTSEKFRKLWEEEAGRLYYGDGYIDSYPEEYFAEAACMMFASEETRTAAEQKLPETYSFLESLFREYVPSLPAPIKEIEQHWAKSAIERLIGLQILTGLPGGKILPSSPVTREQYVKILLIASGGSPSQANGPDRSAFSDVPATRWSSTYINEAVNKGWVLPGEYDDARFLPGRTLTRLEMAVMAARALRLQENVNALASFPDSSVIPVELQGAAGAAVAAGLLKGLPGGKFGPDAEVTRAQAAAVTANVLASQAQIPVPIDNQGSAAIDFK